MANKKGLNEELLKIKKYMRLLENYEIPGEDDTNEFTGAVQYPVYEEEDENEEVIPSAYDENKVSEYFDETGASTPYGEDTGVITPEFVEEAPRSKSFTKDIYHKTLRAALEKAEEYAAKKGYTIDPEEMFRLFGTGGVSYETTKKGSLTLYKDGVPQKKMLHIQIYRMPSGNYELNDYINEKHLSTPEEHDEYEEQLGFQKLINLINSENPELDLIKKTLYSNGLYMKLLKLKSGKKLDDKNEVLKGLENIVLKMENPEYEHIKDEILHLVDELMDPQLAETSCGCDEMYESIKTISKASLITEAIVESEKLPTFDKLISILLHSDPQVQIFHRQTKSYSEHKALNEYYDEIVDLIDGLIESWQGTHGLIKKYKNFEYMEYVDNKATIAYFTELYDIIQKLRQDIEESWIQNQIDNVCELISTTIYKLTYLK